MRRSSLHIDLTGAFRTTRCDESVLIRVFRDPTRSENVKRKLLKQRTMKKNLTSVPAIVTARHRGPLSFCPRDRTVVMFRANRVKNKRDSNHRRRTVCSRVEKGGLIRLCVAAY